MSEITRKRRTPISRPSSRRSAHTRWHTKTGKVSDSCKHCIEDQQQKDQSE